MMSSMTFRGFCVIVPILQKDSWVATHVITKENKKGGWVALPTFCTFAFGVCMEVEVDS